MSDKSSQADVRSTAKGKDVGVKADDDTFEQAYAAIKRDIEKEGDPIPLLEKLEEIISFAMLGESSPLSERHRHHFLHEALPSIVRALTHRRFKESDDQFLRTNEFFTHVLDLIIAFMPADIPGLLETLNRIFDDNRPYYSLSYYERDDLLYARLQSQQTQTDKQLAEYAIYRKSLRASRFLVYNINYFVNKGGLEAMINRIRNEENKLPVPLLKLIIMVWFRIKDFLVKEIQAKWFPCLESTFSLLLGLTEEELRAVRKEDVEEIVRNMEAIMREYAYQSAFETSERFCLDFALKCFRSSNLEKRLHGLSYIDEAIQMTKRRGYHPNWDDTYMSPNYSLRMPAVAKWMEPKFLLQWIGDNQIFESLFQSKMSDMHPELIKRSKSILRYMATERYLRAEHLDMLWKATQTQHAVDAVYEILGHICSHMDLDLQRYLLGMIQRIPFADYTAQTINLISQFHTYPAHFTEIKLKSLNVLWQLVQDDSKADQSIVDTALEHLMKLTTAYSLRPHRHALMNTWLERIARRQSVYQCILLLHKMFESFYDESEMHIKDSENSRQRLLNDFKNTHQLVDLLFRELTQYKLETWMKVQELEEEGVVIDRANAVFVGRYPHIKALRTRLEFIQFCMDYSSARLTSIRADIIWDALVMNAICTEEYEMVLGWFYRICMRFDKVNANTVSSIMAAHFFTKRLSKMDAITISTNGFDCFRRYFCCVNSQKDSIKMESPIDNLMVIEFDEMVGVDSLWTIVLSAESLAVFQDAMNFLVSIYQKVTVDSPLSVHDLRKRFVDRCMQYLKQAHARLAQSMEPEQRDIEIINRLILTLKTFLEECKKSDAGQDILGPLPLPAATKSRVLSRYHNPPKIPKYKEEDVAFVANMMQISEIAAALAMEPRNWNVEATTNWLLDDKNREYILKEAAKYENPDNAALEDNMMVEEVKEEVAPFKPPSVSLYLSENQEYFDLLFDLLNFNQINADKVWEILIELPTNPTLERNLKLLRDTPEDAPDWAHLLDERSVYKMLYCLKILDSLMVPSDTASEREIAERQAWCRRFFYCRGFHHVLQLLLAEEFRQRTTGGVFKSCLRLILKIICHFIQGGLGNATSIFDALDIKPDAPAEQPMIGPQPQSQSQQQQAQNNAGASAKRKALALSATTGKHLVDAIHFPDFLRVLVQLTWSISQSRPLDSVEDPTIVRYALSLVVASILSHPELLVTFYHCAGAGTDEDNVFSPPASDRQQHPKDAQQGEEDEAATAPIGAFVISLVLEHPDSHVRQAAADAFSRLCLDLPMDSIPPDAIPPQTFFLDLLLGHLPAEDSTSTTCEQYFHFLEGLVSEYYTHHAAEEALTKFAGLMNMLVERVRRRPMVEESPSNPPDEVLVGFMGVLSTLLARNAAAKRAIASPDGDDLIMELWERCLFSPPQPLDAHPQGPRWKAHNKCKTMRSREACFRLLAELARDCPENLHELWQLVFPNHEKELEIQNWDRPPIKNESGYVGLHNPGCICYMNSLLQQIFMTPTLRYGLMTVQPPALSTTASPTSNNNSTNGAASPADTSSSANSDNILVQLQTMFGYLQHSERQYYDPSESFCKAFKDRSGNPIDLHMQQDAEEFLRLLCEKLEESLKGTQHEKLLNNFTGVESQILRCSNDHQHFSERQDPLSVISIEIKGKANLEEALSDYVQGEQVEWKCHKCDKMVENALKRISLKKLPNTLIIHLKRFDFNYETMLRAKLSNLFEFPMDLDMEPYTTEGVARREKLQEMEKKQAEEGGGATREGAGAPEEELMQPTPMDVAVPTEDMHPPAYYKYELVGVLVHSGTAEAGHYYSFIKDRTSPTPKWYLFDDRRVRPWDIKDYREEWFGGEHVTTLYDDVWQSTSKEPRQKNAYMLFYQRKNPEPEEFPVPAAVQNPSLLFSSSSSSSSTQENGGDDDKKATGGIEKGKDKVSEDDDHGKPRGAEGARMSEAAAMQLKRMLEDPPRSSSSSSLEGEGDSSGGGGANDAHGVLNDEIDPTSYFDSLFSSVVPKDVLNIVWEENYRVTKLSQLFEAPYLRFVRDLLALSDSNSGNEVVLECKGPLEDDFGFKMLRTATYFVLDTLVRVREETLYRSVMASLRNLYIRHLPASRWLLSMLSDDRNKYLRYHLLECNDDYARISFAELVVFVLRTVAPCERDLLHQERMERLQQSPYDPAAPEPPMFMEPEYTYVSKSIAVRFVECLLAMSESTRTAWRRFHQYWWVLLEYANVGHPERLYMVDRGVIGVLIDYYMGEFSPYKRPDRVKLADKAQMLDLRFFFDLVGLLVRSSATFATLRGSSRPSTCLVGEQEELAVKPLKCRRLLFNADFFASMVKQGYNPQAAGVIITHESWEEEDRSYWIMKTVMSNMSKSVHAPFENCDHVLHAIDDMLAIGDSLQQWRCSMLLSSKGGGLLALMEHFRRYVGFLYKTGHLLHAVIERNPVAAAYLWKTKEEYGWLLKCLTEHGWLAQAWPPLEGPRAEDQIKILYDRLGPFLEGTQEYTLRWDEELDQLPRKHTELKG